MRRLCACPRRSLAEPQRAVGLEGHPGRPQGITEREDGLQLLLGGDFGRAEIFLPFLGRFNALNALACAGSWLALGHDPDRVFEAMGLLEPVAGRLQRFDVRGAPLSVVDYAHTPDALRQALAALRPVAKTA